MKIKVTKKEVDKAKAELVSSQYAAYVADKAAYDAAHVAAIAADACDAARNKYRVLKTVREFKNESN